MTEENGFVIRSMAEIGDGLKGIARASMSCVYVAGVKSIFQGGKCTFADILGGGLRRQAEKRNVITDYGPRFIPRPLGGPKSVDSPLSVHVLFIKIPCGQNANGAMHLQIQEVLITRNQTMHIRGHGT